MNSFSFNIPRPVETLIGTEKISKFLGVRIETIRELAEQGAPILRRGKRGDMVCDKAELWLWYKNHLRP